MILTCGCKVDSQSCGIFCEWDTETRECEPAIAYGVLCSKHYMEYEARPTEDRLDAQRDGVSLNSMAHPKTNSSEPSYEIDPTKLESVEIDLPNKPLTDQELLKMAADKFHYTEYKLAIEFARAIERAHGIGE